MEKCPTEAIQVVLNFTQFHILVESIAKRITGRMIDERLDKHLPQPPEGDKTWDIPRGDFPRKFSYVKKFTTKLGTKIEWDKYIILKHNGNVIE